MSDVVPLSDLLRVFARIGLLSFGEPTAQIALMHRELVEERPWLSENEFLGALSFCMLLPGPEAMQLATFAGWRQRGTLGGLIGGGLFVLPGALVIAGLALLYGRFGALPLIEALFLGVKAAVVVIVLEALLKISRRALKSPDRWLLAGLSFIGIYVFALPFPLIVLAAGLYGGLTATASDAAPPDVVPAGTLRTVGLWGALWLGPIAGLWIAGNTFLTDIALFFAKLAVMSFGGAYAVLAYMTQSVVQDHGWISTGEMLDGLGLAETTPGPLILVTQFVAMLAGFGAGGPGLALIAGLTALWVTFIPCFLWIFAGAPYLDWIASRPRLSDALSAIMAAVVGVILNLSVWFALHVIFARTNILSAGPIRLLVPELASAQWGAVALAVLAGVAIVRLRWSIPRVLALNAVAALALHLLA